MIFPSPVHNLLFFPNRLIKLPLIWNFIYPWLKVNYIEDSLGVLDMHRFPFFTEILWYVLDRYVTCLTGSSSLDLPEEEKKRMRLEKGDHIDPNKGIRDIMQNVIS